MPHAHVNGIDIHYQQAGTGPDVVLLHGFTANLAVWVFIDIVDTLSSEFRVTTFDLRGHGNSEAPPIGYTSADMAADLYELHTALGLEPAYMVGHSLGGVVATHAAVLYPQIVKGLVLSDSYFPGLKHVEPDMGSAAVWQELRMRLLRVDAEIGEQVDFNRLFQVVNELSSEQFQTLRKHFGATGARWLTQLSRLSSTSAGDETTLVAGLTAPNICFVEQPVVALYDEHSPFKKTAEFLQVNLPDCTVDIVPGTEHLALLQNPSAFVGMVYKYLCQLANITPRYAFRRCPECDQANLLRDGMFVCSVCGADLKEAQAAA
jgi:pimeloyl-ACP methyl ester carboxylesterase